MKNASYDTWGRLCIVISTFLRKDRMLVKGYREMSRIIKTYHGWPEIRAENGWYNMHNDNCELGFCHIEFPEMKSARNVCLPVGRIKQYGCCYTLIEHDIWIMTQLDTNTCGKSHEHWLNVKMVISTFTSYNINHVIPVDSESHPWSKSSPRGELEEVLLACFPSQASSVWYMNSPRANNNRAHPGTYS